MKRNDFGPNADVRIFILLFLLSFFSFAYFKYSVNDVNATPRAALCLAILEDRTFRIDKYEHLTIDKSNRDGHFYCDKAPGSSLVAMPFIAAGYYVLRSVGKTDFVSCEFAGPLADANTNFKIILILGSFGVSLLSAIAVASMYLLGIRLGASRGLAVFCSLFFAFGTPFGSWATVLYGHAATASCLLIATYLAVRTIQESPSAGFRWIPVGFLLALAVWTEYPAAIPACLLAILFVLTSPMPTVNRREEGLPAARIGFRAGFLFLGALPIIIGFGVYNTVCFGGPLATGYQFVSDRFPEMNRGWNGIMLPDASVLFETLFSLEHGILLIVPALIVSPLLAILHIRRGRWPGLNLLAIVIPTYYFLLNASYVYWDTGEIPCRHVTAALPFMVVPFLFGWKEEHPALRAAVVLSLLVSIYYCFLLLTLPITAYSRLFYFKSYYLLAELFRGEQAKNLLYIAGVSPYISYVPVVLVWITLGAMLWRTIHTETGKPVNQSKP